MTYTEVLGVLVEWARIHNEQWERLNALVAATATLVTASKQPDLLGLASIGHLAHALALQTPSHTRPTRYANLIGDDDDTVAVIDASDISMEDLDRVLVECEDSIARIEAEIPDLMEKDINAYAASSVVNKESEISTIAAKRLAANLAPTRATARREGIRLRIATEGAGAQQIAAAYDVENPIIARRVAASELPKLTVKRAHLITNWVSTMLISGETGRGFVGRTGTWVGFIARKTGIDLGPAAAELYRTHRGIRCH